MRRDWFSYDPLTLLATLLVGLLPAVLVIGISFAYLSGLTHPLYDLLRQPHQDRVVAHSARLEQFLLRWREALAEALRRAAVDIRARERLVAVSGDSLGHTAGPGVEVVGEYPSGLPGEGAAASMHFQDWELVTALEVFIVSRSRMADPIEAELQERGEALLAALPLAGQPEERTLALTTLAGLPLELEDPLGFSYALEARLEAAPPAPLNGREFLVAASFLDPASVAAAVAGEAGVLRLPGVPQPIRVLLQAPPLPAGTWALDAVDPQVLQVAVGHGAGATLVARVPVAPLLERALRVLEAEEAAPAGITFRLASVDSLVRPTASAALEEKPPGNTDLDWAHWPLAAPFHQHWQLVSGTRGELALEPLGFVRRLRGLHYLWGGLGVLLLGAGASLLLAVVLSRRVQRSRQKDSFLRLVSHELRTPIASLRMLAETLVLDRVRGPAERQRFLEQIRSESARLADLVERVLEYGRAGTGRVASREVVTDPGELVESAVRHFRECTVDPPEVVVRAAQRFHPVVLDREAVKGVVLNLLSNAHKYAPSGVPIEVTVGEEARQLYIRVEDRGPGIRRRELGKIFRPFRRGTQTGRTPGFGLGLAYCRQVADAHRGHIRVRSRMGVGSAFTLEIPLDSARRNGAPR